MDYRAKFDQELRDIYESFLDLRHARSDRIYPLHSVALRNEPVSLLLHFDGHLAPIEALGFRSMWVEGEFSRGRVALIDLAAVAAHSSVWQLAYGGNYAPRLDTSVKEILARGPGKVWQVNQGNGAFTGAIGAGTIIGVIDTGINIRHKIFLKPGSDKDSRILRIWDMGLSEHDGIKGPTADLVLSGTTYGVEYTDQHINAFLQTPKKKGVPGVKHQDCFGHGTFSAGIAAGDGRMTAKKTKFDFVGVAPGADLIVVKMFYLEKDRGRTMDQLIEDAIVYIERTVQKNFAGRSLVINASLGENKGPHDGLVPLDLFLASHFAGAKGRALVAATGNDGAQRQHAVATLPTTGSVDVPLTVYDLRDKKTTDRSHCVVRDNSQPEILVELWYPALAGTATLSVDLVLPDGKVATGPALGAKSGDAAYKKYKITMTHAPDSAKRPSGAAVIRNVFRIKFLVAKSSFPVGEYTIRLKGPGGTLVRVWTDQFAESHGAWVGFDDPNKQGDQPIDFMDALPAGVQVVDTETINSPASADNVIAVANYNDLDDKLDRSSSQGPLVSYAGPVTVEKPTLAAPGVNITSANAGTSILSTAAMAVVPYITETGTSASAPHVAGVVALLFEKKAGLALPDLIKVLRDTARPPAQPQQFGKGKVDAKAARDKV